MFVNRHLLYVFEHLLSSLMLYSFCYLRDCILAWLLPRHANRKILSDGSILYRQLPGTLQKQLVVVYCYILKCLSQLCDKLQYYVLTEERWGVCRDCCSPQNFVCCLFCGAELGGGGRLSSTIYYFGTPKQKLPSQLNDLLLTHPSAGPKNTSENYFVLFYAGSPTFCFSQKTNLLVSHHDRYLSSSNNNFIVLINTNIIF